MHGLVMTSPEGGALRPALLWPGCRATSAVCAYQLLGSATRARQANPLAPGMAGPLLAWIAQNEPRTYAARWGLQPKDWLRARLTGEFQPEPSDASATLLYDVAGGVASSRDVQLTIGTGAQVIRPVTAAVSRADDGINLYRSATPEGWYYMGAALSAGLSLGSPLYAVDVPAASGRGAALLGARAAGLLSSADIQGPVAPPVRLVAQPDPAAAAFHAERHARFRRTVAALGTAQASAGWPGKLADGEEGTA